jgi:hypothetical protein
VLVGDRFQWVRVDTAAVPTGTVTDPAHRTTGPPMPGVSG